MPSLQSVDLLSLLVIKSSQCLYVLRLDGLGYVTLVVDSI